ncbi:MAG TPA: flagellar basal body-associated FliL family protein [Rhodocyclaceae bacterium]|nr:flagellar basal body-associated FliL family protein [Rhodocyclaceae bacterium]
MAEAKKAEGAETEAPPPKKSKKLLLIIVAAVIALVAAGGVTWYVLSKNKAEATAADEEGDEPPAKVEKIKKSKKEHEDAPPVFVKLDPFTVKLQTEQQEAYLQATPELRVLDAHVGDKIKQYTPEIRHKTLLILSGKKASDVSTPQGVQRLANEMRVTINAIIEPPPPRKKGREEPEPGDLAGPDDPVQAVLFTSFIVQ